MRQGLARATTAALLLLALVLAGCVQVDMQSEFEEDGGARHTLETTIDRDTYEQLQSFGGDSGEMDLFANDEEAQRQAEEAGLGYERIDDDERIGARVSKEVDDSQDVGAAFDEIFSTSADEGSPSGVGAIDGTFRKEDDEYILEMTIDSDTLFGDASAEELQGFSMDQLVNMTYTATFPGEVKETNGEKLDSDTVRWRVPATGVTEIRAVAEAGGGSGSTILIVAILLGLLAIGGIVAGLLFTRRRPAPAPLGGSPAPPPDWGMPRSAPGAGAPPETPAGMAPPPAGQWEPASPPSGPPTWQPPATPPTTEERRDDTPPPPPPATTG